MAISSAPIRATFNMGAMNNKRLLRLNAGFSLIEIIVAILIMSIISIGLIRFIINSAEGYSVAATRNQVSSAGRVVIDRISMELHNALPNSVRITPATPVVLSGGEQCIEFIPVIAATTYINPRFRPPASTGFDVLEFIPDQNAAEADYPALYVAIYPSRVNEIYDASRQLAGGRGPIAEVTAVTDIGGYTDNLAIVSHRFNRRSRSDRAFLIEQPVSFCVSQNKVYRYANYGFVNAQLTPAGLPATTPDRVLITTLMDNESFIAFDYVQASRRRNGVVQMEMNFAMDDESVLLNHEVLLQSAP